MQVCLSMCDLLLPPSFKGLKNRTDVCFPSKSPTVLSVENLPCFTQIGCVADVTIIYFISSFRINAF